MATIIAKGIHDHPFFKLGAILGDDVKDDRTITLSKFIKPEAISAPKKWDFDKKRSPFMQRMWGNDQYGDCELAARANYVNRIMRAETRRTSLLSDSDVIDLYRQMTGCETPGDNNDTGLTTLANLKQWRSGWAPPSLVEDHPNYKYSIDVYGYVDYTDPELLRLSTYLFNGVLLGIDMPITAAYQTDAGEAWDYVPDGGIASEPGSWGGHCVHTKRYEDGSIYVLTWAREIRVTDAFIKNYVVEAWSAIESFKTWTTYKHALDVQGLIDEMADIGIEVES